MDGILKEYAKIDYLLDPLLKESIPIIYKQWETYIQKEIDKIKKIIEEDNQTKINYLYEEEKYKNRNKRCYIFKLRKKDFIMTNTNTNLKN